MYNNNDKYDAYLQGGMYVFQLFDNYAASLPIIPIGFLEATAIGWLYGTNILLMVT
jgi:hypothetical protein